MKRFLYNYFGYHSQNIAKEDAKDYAKAGKPYKGSWVSWRCWWKVLGKPFRLELHSKFGFSGKIEFDWEDHEITFHIAPLFFSLYFTIGKVLKGDWRRGRREFGFNLHEEFFWITIWTNPHEWNSSDPWWQHITIHWKDILFGKLVYTSTPIRKEQTTLCLPEANYPINIEFSRCTWVRPRRIFGNVDQIQADMKCEKGIPVPGKGENSWDCGDDATYSLWCQVPTGTTAEALGKLLETIVDKRRRHGSGINMYAPNKLEGARS